MKQILSDFHKNLTEIEKTQISQNLFDKVTSLPEYKNAELLFAYIPDVLEADCLPVILDAFSKDKKVCVPKVDFESLKNGGSKMDFYFLDSSKNIEEQLETGAYGIKEPKSGLKSFVFDCKKEISLFMIVPGVAFTKDGKRCGHGKGFYDIYIEKLKNSGFRPYRCGFAFPCQIVEELPVDEHDILMDKVVF